MVFPVPPDTQAALYSCVGCSLHKSALFFLNYMRAGISPAEILPGPNLGGASFPKKLQAPTLLPRSSRHCFLG